jgi:type IV secretory pathway VirB10-like protein
VSLAPPPPQGLPPPARSVRSLRMWLVLLIVLLLFATVGGVIWWSLYLLGNPQEAKAETTQQTGGQGTSLQDLLANAPTGVEIARAGSVKADDKRPPPPPDPHVEPKADDQKQTSQPPIDDNMTDAAVAARRAAWAAYGQQYAQMLQDKAQRTRDGMKADLDPQQQQQPPSDNTQGGPGTAQQQQQKPTDFFSSVASNPATDYSPFTLTDSVSPYELKAGDIITAKLESGLNSDSQGYIRALVSKDVHDYATGNHILIPQGSRLFGTYMSGQAYGQTRVMVAWTRVIYPGPCSQSLDLGAMYGADQTGQAGFSDITENHYGKIFLNAMLVSLFSAGIQLSQPPSSALQQYSPVQSAGGAVGQQMGQLGMEFARRGMDIPPTQRIRQGYPFVVMLHKDIPFEAPWQAGVCKRPQILASSQ